MTTAARTRSAVVHPSASFISLGGFAVIAGMIAMSLGSWVGIGLVAVGGAFVLMGLARIARSVDLIAQAVLERADAVED